MNGTDPEAMMAHLSALAQAGRAGDADALLDQLLEAHPAFMPAQRWRLDALLEEGAHEAALELARALPFQFPDMRAMAVTKQAVALERLGQNGAAIQALSTLHEAGAQDVVASLLLGRLLVERGALNRAEGLFEAVLAAEPANREALRGAYDVAVAKGQMQRALDLCSSPEARTQFSDDETDRKRARCLTRLGADAEAIAALSALETRGTAREAEVLALARLYQKTGDLAAAQDRLVALVDTDAPQEDVVLTLMSVRAGLGDLDGALSACDAGLAAHTDAPEALLRRRAQILMRARRIKEAAEVFEALLARADPAPTLYLDCAEAHLQTRDLQRADQRFQVALLVAETQERALLGRVQIAHMEGRDADAVTWLQVAATQSDAPAISIALSDALIRAQAPQEVADVLERLVARADELADGQVAQVLGLAERQALTGLAKRMIDRVAARDTLSSTLALRVLKLAHNMAQPDLLQRVANGLTGKIAHSERHAFAIEMAALVDGPAAALALARRRDGAPDRPGGMIQLARQIIGTGQVHLAMRYMRRAVRHAPQHPALNGFYVHCCGLARDFAAGHAHLDQMQRAAPSIDIEADRLRLLHLQGATQETFERACARWDTGLPGLHPRQYLDLCLARGDLERAQEAMHHMRSDPANAAPTAAAHFTTGLHGRMLTDLHVFRMLEAKAQSDGTEPEAARDALVDQYYYPAKMRLEAWLRDQSAPGRRSAPIPARIYQYWDSATVPSEVNGLIEDWRRVPGFEHVLLNRTSALTMLRRNFAKPVVKAFLDARHVTEESDLLRLCVLVKFGGIYSDADDRVVGDIAQLAELGTGLVLSQEPIGALANNTLITPPGNPVLRIALKMTVEAMGARDADGAWFKSGPGMLTRAAAVYLRDRDETAQPCALTVLDGDTLRRFIQPHVRLAYKSTSKYWNAQTRDMGRDLVRSIVSDVAATSA